MASPSDVKAYLKQHRRSSLTDMAIHFGVSADTMNALIEPWLAKNKVQRLDGEKSCNKPCSKSGGCCGTISPIYEWCEAP
jgi:hypothetical protein